MGSNNLEAHSYLDANDWQESNPPAHGTIAHPAMPTPPSQGYSPNPSLRLNWPGLSTPDSIRQAYGTGVKTARFLPVANDTSTTPIPPPPQASGNSFYASPSNGGNGTLTPRQIVPSDVPVLNQNTTGTAGGLSGTPNITVGTITSGNVSVTGTVACTSYFACNGATPTAPTTGWGTPTGGSVSNNFAGGSANLATTSAAVAEIISVLLAAGIIKA